MRNREECRSGSKYNLMQKTSFERIGLWARGKSAGVSETSFCGLQRERGRFGLASQGGEREERRFDNVEKGGPPNTNFVQEAK